MESTDDIEMLVTRRSKRSTAGNRMEAALAEMASEDLSKEIEDDIDFIDDKVEEDVFGSDFASTDEEAETNAQEAGEKEIEHEEKRVKKAARSRLERVTAAAHAKHKSSFNTDIQLNSAPKTKAAKSQQISSRGEIVDAGAKIGDERIRTSKRMHTVLNSSATVKRLKQSEARRASLPKKAKTETKRYTQAELIALALDTEEGNIVEHRDYLKNEAEKRKRARVLRTAVTGPLLRWTSRHEQIKVPVTPPPPPPPATTPAPTSSSVYRSVYGPPGSLFTPTTYSYSGGATVVSTVASTSGSAFQPTGIQAAASSQPSTSTFLSYQHYMDPSLSPFPTWPISNHQSYYAPATLKPTQSTSTSSVISATPTVLTTPAFSTTSATSTTTPAVSTAPTVSATLVLSTASTVSTTPTASTTPTVSTTPVILSTPATSSTPTILTVPSNSTMPAISATPTTSTALLASSATAAVQPLVQATSSITDALNDTVQQAQSTVDTKPQPPPEPDYREETVTKNYLIHELEQKKGAPKASWTETMQAMFGDHVKWNEMKVFVGKGRPLSRPRQTCIITGRQAHYIDPRTGVPYADSYAYKVLTGLLRHEYVWNPSLGCYVDHGNAPDVVLHREEEVSSGVTAEDAMDED